MIPNDTISRKEIFGNIRRSAVELRGRWKDAKRRKTLPNALNVTIGEDVEVQTAAEAPTRTFKIDFDAGRVGGFCDETEAMKQAIYKILQTERFEYLIYQPTNTACRLITASL